MVDSLRRANSSRTGAASSSGTTTGGGPKVQGPAIPPGGAEVVVSVEVAIPARTDRYGVKYGPSRLTKEMKMSVADEKELLRKVVDATRVSHGEKAEVLSVGWQPVTAPQRQQEKQNRSRLKAIDHARAWEGNNPKKFLVLSYTVDGVKHTQRFYPASFGVNDTATQWYERQSGKERIVIGTYRFEDAPAPCHRDPSPNSKTVTASGDARMEALSLEPRQRVEDARHRMESWLNTQPWYLPKDYLEERGLALTLAAAGVLIDSDATSLSPHVHAQVLEKAQSELEAAKQSGKPADIRRAARKVEILELVGQTDAVAPR